MSVLIRTSLTHPLQIAEVSAPAAKGRIGITFCPGKKQANAGSGTWDRDLGRDLDAIAAWGASTIVTLIEPHEMEDLKVSGLGKQAAERGLAWLHMPITDMSEPDHRFEAAWQSQGARLLDGLRQGKKVLVHCKGGLGRAGTVAALMLVELGVAPEDAIQSVRRARKGAIETKAQEHYVNSHAARAGVETVLEVGADGGSIRLVCRQGRKGPEFRVQTSESALFAGDPDLAPPVRPWVESWEEVLGQLDRYPWAALHPLEVHPAFRDAVALAVKHRAGDAQHVDWQGWDRVLRAQET